MSRRVNVVPRPRRLVVVAVLVEALIVAGYGVYLGWQTVVAEATERLAAGFLVVLVAGLAAALVAAARAAGAGRPGARAPILVWQALQASLALPALSERWYVAVPLLGLAVLATVAVFAPGAILDARGADRLDPPTPAAGTDEPQ